MIDDPDFDDRYEGMNARGDIEDFIDPKLFPNVGFFPVKQTGGLLT